MDQILEGIYVSKSYRNKLLLDVCLYVISRYISRNGTLHLQNPKTIFNGITIHPCSALSYFF